MNTIGKISFDFTADHQQFACSLYGAWDDFFASSVERVADQVLSLYDRADEHITIDLLTLDMGNIGCEDFYEEFPLRLREKLGEALSCLEYDNRLQASQAVAVRASLADDAFTLLTLFLLHGRMDVLRLAEYGDLNSLFLSVVRLSGARLSTFLCTYGHYTGLQERIVGQFDDQSLEAGVRMLQPEGGGFICSYVRLLHKRYPKLERPAITQSGYRYAVWSVVYSYLFGNRSSYFNRKSFLVQTLLSLSVKLNIAIYNDNGIPVLHHLIHVKIIRQVLAL